MQLFEILALLNNYRFISFLITFLFCTLSLIRLRTWGFLFSIIISFFCFWLLAIQTLDTVPRTWASLRGTFKTEHHNCNTYGSESCLLCPQCVSHCSLSHPTRSPLRRPEDESFSRCKIQFDLFLIHLRIISILFHAFLFMLNKNFKLNYFIIIIYQYNVLYNKIINLLLIYWIMFFQTCVCI